jgi:hypothetical protein
MGVAWFPLGCAVAVLSGWSIRWTVVRLDPRSRSQALAWVLIGAGLRWGLAAVVLMMALRQGAGPGLTAFLGMFAGHWLSVAWLARVGRLREASGG